MIKMIFIMFFCAFVSHSAENTINYKEIDKIVESVENSFRKISDYKCVFHKKELVKDKYVEQNNIVYKFKKPNYYYMKWTEGDDEGMEVIYAGKKYNNQIKVHPGGTFKFITTKIDPNGSMAMKNNRHSILESDIGYVVSLIKSNYQKAKENSEGLMTIEKDTGTKSRDGLILTAVFPENKGYYCKKIIIYIDKELNLPVHFKVYDWNNKLLESYKFTSIKINTLNAMDFSSDNPEYHF